ncbi:FOG: WD40 repeat [Richelia intracellularis]|nr:FOG: WD40 repeat [Richelia intracellularis]
MEAVDQFFADSQTLPELSLELQPVSKRYGGATQVLLKQAVPASVGVASLAAAGVAFGMLPIPEFRPTQKQNQSNQSNVQNSPSPSQTASTGENTNTTSTAKTDNTNNPSIPVRNLEALLKSVAEITNASQLRALNRQVYNQINPKWQNRKSLKQDLIYRIGVAADGAIIGYKAVNKEANTEIEATPLSQLLYNTTNQKPITNEPMAQFRVVFRKSQVLEVSPWNGYTNTPDVVGQKITDAKQVKQLRQKLFDNIRENWGGTPTYKQVLKYRVAIKIDGLIADYEPLNQLAFDHYRETPLPKMFSAIYGSNVTAPNNKEPLAHYQVEFSPSGQLDVKPWKGYR